jgi:hypothetical protein
MTYNQWNCRLAFYLFVALAAAHQAPPKVSPPPPVPVVTPSPRLPETMLAAAFGLGSPRVPNVQALDKLNANRPAGRAEEGLSGTRRERAPAGLPEYLMSNH